MRIARVVVIASLATVGVASATLGISTNSEMAQHAQVVAIVHVIETRDGMLDGLVTKAFRGVAIGQKVHLPAVVRSGTGDALVICDDQNISCGADRDRGGYFIIALPGRKGPVMLTPGLFPMDDLPALVGGRPMPDACMHVKVHFIDEPAADATVECKFSPATGSANVSGTLLGPAPLSSTVVVGGPASSSDSTVTIRNDKRYLSFIGAPITRGLDGCYAVTAIPEVPLARTRKQLDAILAGTEQPTTIAVARLVVAKAVTGIAAGTYTLRFASVGSLMVYSPLFDNGSLAQLDNTGGRLRMKLASKSDPTTTIDLDFGALATPTASLEARIAILVADGKPHDIAVTLRGTPLGTARLTHVAD